MINRRQRMTKLKALLLVALAAAVFLALQFGPAAAQSGGDRVEIPEGSTTVISYIHGDVTFDYSCTGGATGQCQVVYQKQTDDKGEDFWVRIEYRW